MLTHWNLARHSSRRSRSGRSWPPAVEILEDRKLLAAQLLQPNDIRSYYGVNDVKFTYRALVEGPRGPFYTNVTVTGDGTGQTIAIIDENPDPNIANDLKVFDQQYNLPAANLTVISTQKNLPAAGTSWAVEESIDVEWAHAMAPGANIVVVNRPGGASNVPAAVALASNYPGVSVVSMSFGYSEFKSETSEDSDFSTPSNHNGVSISYVAASGDDKSSTAVGPQWPSVSPNVLSVGGTNLIRQPITGTYTEQSWAASQGGASMYEAEPGYQQGVQQSGMRENPDVAFNAEHDPYYDSYSATSAAVPGWASASGTSFGAPAWAGLIAIADQGRVLAGESTLGAFIPEAIYAAPARDFNDITTGPANREGDAPGPGYDEITGRGSPKANLLVPYLVKYDPFVIPPFPGPIHSQAISTGSGLAPQVAERQLALTGFTSSITDGNLAAPVDTAASSPNSADAASEGSLENSDPVRWAALQAALDELGA